MESLVRQVESLAIEAPTNRFLDILRASQQHQVVILSSDTDPDKSIQVPQLVVSSLDNTSSHLRVVCTRPRYRDAVALAIRVSRDMRVVLGEDVGYHVPGDRRSDKGGKMTKLMYMTEDSLLAKHACDQDLSEYSYVIVDEAHERTLDIDILLALLKKTLRRRKDMKVIIMSALLDVQKFQDYFNGCPVVQVRDDRFHVQNFYAEPHPDYEITAANYVKHIHENKGQGDILVFVPSQGSVRRVVDFVSQITNNLSIFPLHLALSTAQMNLAMKPSQHRKCVVSTDIAETRMTVENIVYVIDTGMTQQTIFNPRLAMHMVQIRPMSQSTGRLRSGRAGRTRDGFCYRLFREEDFDNTLAPSTPPMIQCTSINKAVLKLCHAGHVHILDFDFIDAPHPEAITRAAQDLLNLGLINTDSSLTRSGRLAAWYPLEPIWYRATEEGAKAGCGLVMLYIAVLCSHERSIFLPPPHEGIQDPRVAAAFSPSDHLALARTFMMYVTARQKHRDEVHFDLGDWCRQNCLDIEALEVVYHEVRRLTPFLNHIPNFLTTTELVKSHYSIVPKALATAFCTQIAIRIGTNDYRTIPEDVPCRLPPHSCLAAHNFEWVMYTTLEMPDEHDDAIIETATAICPDWLVGLPYFEEDKMPVGSDGLLRQPNVKASLDAAKARLESRQSS